MTMPNVLHQMALYNRAKPNAQRVNSSLLRLQSTMHHHRTRSLTSLLGYLATPGRTIVARPNRRKTRSSSLLSLCLLHPTCQEWQSNWFQWQQYSQVPSIHMPQARSMPTHWRSTSRIQFICLSSVWWICMRFTTTIKDTSRQTCWKTYWYQLWYRHQAFIRRRRLCPEESLEGRISLPPFDQVHWAYLPSDSHLPHQFQIGICSAQYFLPSFSLLRGSP